jgi:predicted dienelactone hydrolase
MRFSNSLLCESLAARGAIVVSADHPGDALADWLLGTFVDNRTNELGRVADANLLLDALLTGHPSFEPDITSAIDRNRVAMAGHSYGVYTALATVAGRRGVAPHPAVKAVVSFQGYTRTLSDAALARVTVPTLLMVGDHDHSTPASTDADRPWQLLTGAPTWRADVAGAGHQASSDIGLYAELVDHVPNLPEVVKAYFAETVVDAVGSELRPWRELLIEQIGNTWAFLAEVFDLDDADAPAELERIIASGGLRLQRR